MRASSLSLMFVAALVIGCGSKSTGSASQELSAPDSGGTPPPIRSFSTSSLSVADLNLSTPQSVPHASDCLVEHFSAADQVLESYREEVISDGSSQFSLKVLESLLVVPADWANRKRIREGFLFRYGSFGIRSESLADQNFNIYGDGSTLVIAGQTCDHYSLALTSGTGSSYEIWVDQASGLVLRSERYDENGKLRFSRVHETVNFSPDLSQAVWFQSIHNEQSLDLTQSLPDQVGLPVFMPKLLPAGYDQHRAYQLSAQNQTWVKLVYTNGIDPLFMLEKPVPSNGGAKNPKNGKLNNDASRVAEPDYDSRLHVLRLDGVTAVHTQQPEGIFEAVGTVDEQELVDMVSSALPND